MKKLLSLLLALTLIFACTIPFAFAEEDWRIRVPLENSARRLDNADVPKDVETCPEEYATVKLELGDGRILFFPVLDKDIFVWAGYQNCDRTFTLLEDQHIFEPLQPQEEWRDVPMTTIDLNGHTITCDADKFYSSHFDAHLTLKNGTILFNGGLFACTGRTLTSVLSDRYGFPASQQIIFEDMEIYCPNGQLLLDYQWETLYAFRNSTAWAQTGILGTKSDGSGQTKYGFDPWPVSTAQYKSRITMENSTVGCAEGTLIVFDAPVTVDVKDSVLVSQDGTLFQAEGGTFTSNMGEETASWTGTVAGNAVSGVAVGYVAPEPEAPAEPEAPVEAPAEPPETPTETPEAPAETPEAPAEEKGTPVGLIVGIGAAVVVIAAVAVVVLKKKKKD